MGKHSLSSKILIYFVLSVFVIIALFPIYWCISSSLKNPKDVFSLPPKFVFTPNLDNYRVLLFGELKGEVLEGRGGIESTGEGGGDTNFPKNYLNSIIIASVSTLASVFLASLAAYSCSRFDFKGKNVFLIGALLTRMIPPVVIIIPVRTIFQRMGLLDTHLGMILAYLSFNLPFSLWLLRAFFSQTSASLEEAAMIDGCSRMGAFFRIAIPLAFPGMISAAILNFVYSWNEFLFALVLTSYRAKTVTPAVVEFITDKAILWGKLYAGSVMIVIIPIIFAIVAQRYIIQGLTLGAVKQ